MNEPHLVVLLFGILVYVYELTILMWILQLLGCHGSLALRKPGEAFIDAAA